uniref:Uncharacterized protein n=1 Tax=Leersia perrieri TaxID=77586 RepID=A0A0D9WKH2_9ORYZ
MVGVACRSGGVWGVTRSAGGVLLEILEPYADAAIRAGQRGGHPHRQHQILHRRRMSPACSWRRRTPLDFTHQIKARCRPWRHPPTTAASEFRYVSVVDEAVIRGALLLSHPSQARFLEDCYDFWYHRHS